MRQHAHYEPEDSGWVTTSDFKALLGLIAFAALFVAICAVAPQ